MHTFTTSPSNQLSHKVRHASLPGLHNASLCIRLILTTQKQGARTDIVGITMFSLKHNSPKDGIIIIKLPHGQLYNGKLAYTYII